VRGDGVRVTFRADRSADGTLSGVSDALGRCHVRTGDVDQVLFGAAIDREAARLTFQQWTLRPAAEPRLPTDGGGSSSGTESALVGNPAPDIQLDLLDGKTFRLSETRGEVVVLDFWASWCGPCMQSMPAVEKVTSEVKARGVRLIAVNLQESPREVTAALRRLKLDLTVALDRDGSVAEKYGAEAIPQTVVIGRDGKVARLYVGGGPHVEGQLRGALEAVLGGEKPPGQ
jgi:peroxiredoxin